MLPILWLAKILNQGEKNVSIIGLVFAFLVWLTGLIDVAVVAVIGTFASTLNAIDIAAFRNTSLAVLEYIGYVNAIIPVSEFCTLMAIYLTAWGIVILLRWVKSLIPMWSN